MPETYTYRVRDRRGSLLAGELQADSRDLVLSRLREQGLIPLEIKVKSKGMGREISFLTRKKVKLKELSVFSRQFATMINSGLPLLRALAILEQQTEGKELAKVIGQIRVDVEQGSALSAAMSKHPHAFSRLYVSMVRAGETGGVLDSVLLRLADTLEREVELRRQIKSAMAYPVVVLIIVVLILSAMLLFVVPTFKNLFADLGGTLPLPTRMLLAVSDIFKRYFIFVFLAFGALIFAFRRWKKTDRGRYAVDRLKLKIPVFGALFHKTAMSRFARTLGALSRSGVPLLQSLDIVAETVQNTIVANAVRDIQSSVKEGESLATPLARHEVFPPMVVQMLAVGEETGALDTMLEKIADFYDEEVKATVDALTALIEPLLIVVIGGTVGLIVISLYLPMFRLVNLIQ
ncbi:MAG TPA: type II secretion system F family protein [Actinomycetota bacterium]|nr:type II secretion system F family protein [Actinomycetota bacterium]